MVKKESTIPLPQSFFATSIFGLIISGGFMISGKLDETWGITFLIVFFMMLVASFSSMAPDRSDL